MKHSSNVAMGCINTIRGSGALTLEGSCAAHTLIQNKAFIKWTWTFIHVPGQQGSNSSADII